MKNYLNISISTSTIIFLSVFRIAIAITGLPEITTLWIMSAINVAAFDFLAFILFFKAHHKMVKKHNTICKEKQVQIKDNKHIISFQKGSYIISIIMILVSIIYIIFLKDAVVNDILTIATLIISVQDEGYIDYMAKKFYRYY